MKLFLTFLLFLLSIQNWAQDIIYTQTDSAITCDIEEVKTEIITYYLWKDVNHTKLQILDKKNVYKIVYADGSQQYFNKENNKQNDVIEYYYDEEKQEFVEKKTNQSAPKETAIVKEKLYDVIHLVTDEKLKGEVINKKKYGIVYTPEKAANGEMEYIPFSKIAKIVYADGNEEFFTYTESNNEKLTSRNPQDFTYLSPHYIAATIGPSIPFGSYADNISPISGGAKLGLDFKIEGTYYFFRGLGVGAMVGYQYHPFNEAQVRSVLVNNLGIPDSQIDVGGWNNVYFGGTIGYFNDFGRLIVDYKILLAGIYSRFPEVSARYTANNQNITSYWNADGMGFSLGGMLNLRYYLTRHIAVGGGLHIQFANVKLGPAIQTNYSEGQAPSTSVSSFGLNNAEQVVSTINFTFGVAYIPGR